MGGHVELPACALHAAIVRRHARGPDAMCRARSEPFEGHQAAALSLPPPQQPHFAPAPVILPTQQQLQMQQMQQMQMQMQQMHAPALPQPQVHAHVSAAPGGDSPVRFRVSAAALPAAVNMPQKSGSYMEMNALLNQLHLERVSAGARCRWHED